MIGNKLVRPQLTFLQACSLRIGFNKCCVHNIGYSKCETRQLRTFAEQANDRSMDDSSSEDNLDSVRQELGRLKNGGSSISGKELRELVKNKWGREFEVRLVKRGSRMYTHIMWKYLGQKSFHLTEEQYEIQLDAVAEYLNMWGVAEVVRQGITSASNRGPGYTGGRAAKAVSIPLGVDLGERSSEWN
eukprot:TRINITY_DN20342_c0_g1_i1.p2 TRINITY_DN20342_c0_g1~~TRINITY_DN20342_c0_g1_i1.p2  ORF type:complete len:188 (+),score=13.22 TRINITY_DN20342_c0_g1_i1:28-591(+)